MKHLLRPYSIAFLFFLSSVFNFISAQCTVGNAIYVAPGANGTGTAASPTNLLTALSIHNTTPARSQIYMAGGDYQFSGTINLPSGVIIEGEYHNNSGTWVKDPYFATNLNINSEFHYASVISSYYYDTVQVAHIIGINIDSAVTNVMLKDLNITVYNPSAPYLDNHDGYSVYGIYTNHASNITILNVTINASTAGNGGAGDDGRNGFSAYGMQPGGMMVDNKNTKDIYNPVYMLRPESNAYAAGGQGGHGGDVQEFVACQGVNCLGNGCQLQTPAPTGNAGGSAGLKGYYRVGGGSGGACGDACSLDCYVQQYANYLGLAETAFNAVFDNSLPTPPPLNPVAHPGVDGYTGINGYSYSGGPKAQLYEMGRFYVPSTGLDGEDGSGGSGGGGAGAGGIRTLKIPDAPGAAALVTDIIKTSLLGAELIAKAAGSNDVCAGQVINASTPGGPGGGGGEGGQGGKGGGGGGAVFGIYTFKSTGIAAGNVTYNLGDPGKGGKGGRGGDGGTGYVGLDGPYLPSWASAISDRGGRGGHGGDGGNGGDGQDGGDGKVLQTWGIKDPLTFAVDTSHLCTNSVIGIVKDAASEIFVNGYGKGGSGSTYMEISLPTTGLVDIFQTSNTAWTHRYFTVNKTRSLPDFNMNGTLCFYDVLSVTSKDTAEGYSWKIVDTKDNVLATSTSKGITFTPPVIGTSYKVSLQTYQSCCGWSLATVKQLYVEGPSHPVVSQYGGVVGGYFCYGTDSSRLQVTGVPTQKGIQWSNGAKDTSFTWAKTNGLYYVVYTSPAGCQTRSDKKHDVLINVFDLPNVTPPPVTLYNGCDTYDMIVAPPLSSGTTVNFYYNATTKFPQPGGKQVYEYQFRPNFGFGASLKDSMVLYTAYVSEYGCVGTNRGTITIYHEKFPPQPKPYTNFYSVGANSSNCGAAVYFDVPEGYDDCSLFVSRTLLTGKGPGSYFPVGTSKVVYRLKDGYGNFNDVTTTINVQDNTPPAITSYAYDTVTSTLPGKCQGRYNFKPTTAIDNCTGKLTSYRYSTMGYYLGDSLFPLGVTQMTTTFMDSSSNMTSSAMQVTVKDHEPPVITCPSDLVYYLPRNSKTFYTGYNIPLATDNCSTIAFAAHIVSGFGQFGYHPCSVTTETYAAQDGSGNTSTCSFKISVLDTIKPTITCPDPVYFKTDVGKSYTTITYGVPTGSDYVSSFVTIGKLSGKASGDTAGIGIHTAIWTATDSSGNVATCPVKITVSDEQAPNLICPGNIYKVNDPGSCSAVVNYTVAPALDNDLTYYTPSLISGFGLPSGSAFPLGTTNVAYTVADASNNKAFCTFNVTVADTVKPVFTKSCPHDTTLSVTPAICGAMVALPSLTGTDNGCVSPSLDLMNGSVSGRYEVGTTTQMYRLRDGAGNARYCSYNVTVVDNNTLTVTCPNNIDLNTDPGKCSAYVIIPSPVIAPFYNSCISYGYTSSYPAGSNFPIGSTALTYTVTANGNNASCNLTVTIHDIEKPHIVSPSDIVTDVDPGNCGKVVNFTEPVGTDNCTNGLSTYLMSGLHAGSNFPVGTTVETFVVGDLSGNTDTARFTVTVRDTIQPSIPVHSTVGDSSNQMCGKNMTFTEPVGTDNSGCVKTYRIAGRAPGDLFPIGVTQEVYVARDSAGHTDTCRFNVVVGAKYPLQSNCMDNWLQADPAGFGAVVYYPVPGVTDMYTGIPNPCPGVTTILESGLGSGAYFLDGPHLEKYAFVVKGTGDTVRCSTNVILTEFTPPVITCPTAFYQVAPDSGQCYATIKVDDATATDNSGGPVTITRFVDGTPSNDTIFPTGSHSLSYQARDYSGNTALCAINFTVQDEVDFNGIFYKFFNMCAGQSASFDPKVSSKATGLKFEWVEQNYYTTVSTDTILRLDSVQASDAVPYRLKVIDRCGQTNFSPTLYTRVYTPPTTTLTGLNSAYCVYDSTDISINVTPSGGILTIDGIVGNKFNPKKAGIGIHTIVYSYADASAGGCAGTSMLSVGVYDKPKASVFADSVYCINTPAITLPAANNIYSGAGISGNMFNPATAGAGNHSIACTTTVNGCSVNFSQNIRVNAVIPNAAITAPSSVCNSSGNYQLTTASSGGAWSGRFLTIDSISGTARLNSRNVDNGNDTITYTITKSACTATNKVVINVKDKTYNLPYTFPQFCTTDAPVAFDTTGRKSYFGTGFSNNIFTPSAPGFRGPMFYSVVTVNANGCVDTNYRLLNLRGGQLNVYRYQQICTKNDSVYINLKSEYDSIKWFNGSTSNKIWLKDTGNYIVHLRDTLGCSGQDTVFVAYYQKPAAYFLSTPSVYACPNDSAYIIADSTFLKYQWNTTNAADTTNKIKVGPGAYHVRVLTANGCYYQSDTVHVVTGPDNVKPTITCAADTTLYTTAGNCFVTAANFILPGTFDNCAVASLSNNAPSGNKYPVGVTLLTWTVKDKAGNSSSCAQKITVKDTLKPYFTSMPPALIVDTALNNCSSRIPDVASKVMASDSCSGVKISQSPAAGTFVTTKTTPVVVTAKDSSGNTVAYTFFYESVDTISPVLNCPADINVNTSGTTAVVTYAAPTHALNCSNSTVTRIAGLGSGASFPIGTTIEKYVVTDGAGGTDTCSFKVTVSVPTTIAKNKTADDVLTVMPNPAQDKLNIHYVNNNASTLRVKITTANGQLLLDESINQFNGTYNKALDMSDQAVGVYFLEIITEQQVITRKIVKI